MSKWFPMETAPKDGSYVILGSTYAQGMVGRCHFVHDGMGGRWHGQHGPVSPSFSGKVFGWTPCPEWGEVELPHLQLGDAVVFDTGGMGLNYVVTNFYLKNLFGRNDAIFANLGFTAGGKERFAEAYGSKNTRAIFPEFPNLESLTHFVNEIHNLCANPDQLKVALEKYNMESTSIPTVTDPNVPVSSNMVNIVVEEIETPKVKKPRKFKVGDFVRHEEGWDGIVVEVDKKDQNVPYKCYCYYSGSCRWSAPKSLTLVKKVRKDKKLGEV